MAVALANPIYDTVFKFLLEDLDIARDLIAEIINQEIISIQVKPQENMVSVESGIKSNRADPIFFTVYRLDFLAEIKTLTGTKKVLIELQKAKLSTDIMRFRRYLREQYSKDSLPIITIYFLGYKFSDHLPSVLEISRTFKDRLNNKIIEYTKNEFIDSLTHESFTIQLYQLKTEMRNRLEKVLSIFSQAAEKLKDHIVYYDYPMDDELQKRIVHRLLYAAPNETLKRQMDLEEEVLMELQDLERKIETQKEEIYEKDKALEEKDRALEETKKALEEKEKLIQELMKKVKED